MMSDYMGEKMIQLFGAWVSSNSEEDMMPIIAVMKRNNIPYSMVRKIKNCIEPCPECAFAYSTRACQSCPTIRVLKIIDGQPDCFVRCKK